MSADDIDGINRHVATLMGIVMGDSYASSAPFAPSPAFQRYTAADLKADQAPPKADAVDPNAQINLGGDAQLAAGKAAYLAGFRGEALVNIIAIAGRESAFNPASVGDVKLEDGTWGPSVGLFQIRTMKNETGTGQARDIARLQNNPIEQAKAAFELSGGGKDFGPWRLHGGSFLDSTNVVEARRIAQIVEGGG